jgi:hypothetical protein
MRFEVAAVMGIQITLKMGTVLLSCHITAWHQQEGFKVKFML